MYNIARRYDGKWLFSPTGLERDERVFDTAQGAATMARKIEFAVAVRIKGDRVRQPDHLHE